LPILVNIGDLLEDVSDHARSCGLIRTYRILILREVDRRPSKVHSPPRHLPSHANRVPRPLLARVLLPSTRRRPARTSAQRSRARSRSEWQSKWTKDSRWQGSDDGEGPPDGALGCNVLSGKVMASRQGKGNRIYKCLSVIRSNYQRKQKAEIRAQVELTRSPPCGYCGLSGFASPSNKRT
jgi:hypothetical protein